MKSKVLIMATVVSTCAFSFSVFSQESKFCKDPIKSVCIDTDAQVKARNTYIDEIKKETLDQATIAAEPIISKIWVPILRSEEKMTNYYNKVAFALDNEIVKISLARIKEIEASVINQKNILLYKSYMKKAIDETQFSRSTRENFKKKVDAIKIGTYYDYLNVTGLLHETKPIYRGFECGTDGMKSKAFILKTGHGPNRSGINYSSPPEDYVFICPGQLFTLNQISNEEERFTSILQVITREMGKYMFELVTEQDETYFPFLNCFKENYHASLRKSDGQKTMCNSYGIESPICREAVVGAHRTELVANHWGNRVLALYAREHNYSTTQMESMIKSNFAHTCNEEDDILNPSGKFRIEMVLRLDPKISDLLSCNNSAVKKPACTFEGSINL